MPLTSILSPSARGEAGQARRYSNPQPTNTTAPGRLLVTQMTAAPLTEPDTNQLRPGVSGAAQEIHPMPVVADGDIGRKPLPWRITPVQAESNCSCSHGPVGRPNRAEKRTVEPRRPRRVLPAARGRAVSRFHLVPHRRRGRSRPTDASCCRSDVGPEAKPVAGRHPYG